MSNGRLLWLMILKEFRTTVRERAQVRGVIISAVIMAIVLSNAFYQTRRSNRHPKGWHQTPAALVQPAAIRWVVIAASAAVGFIFSLGFLLSAVIASFVGEKENKTLEILLASPLSDEKLFSLKAISVLLPSAFVGAICAYVSAGLAQFLIPQELVHVPGVVMLYAPALGIVAMMLFQLWFVGMGAGISAKAETQKGAQQTLGLFFIAIVFGGFIGVPALLTTFPALQTWVSQRLARWLTLPFTQQYGMLIVVLGVPALLLMAFGRANFRRDRMLT